MVALRAAGKIARLQVASLPFGVLVDPTARLFFGPPFHGEVGETNLPILTESRTKSQSPWWISIGILLVISWDSHLCWILKSRCRCYTFQAYDFQVIFVTFSSRFTRFHDSKVSSSSSLEVTNPGFFIPENTIPVEAPVSIHLHLSSMLSRVLENRRTALLSIKNICNVSHQTTTTNTIRLSQSILNPGQLTFWTQKLSSLDKKQNPYPVAIHGLGQQIASSCILEANSSACHFWWASNMPELDGLNLLLEGKHVLLIFCSKWFWTHLDHWVSTSASFVLCRCPLPSDNLCAGPVLHKTSWSLEEG